MSFSKSSQGHPLEKLQHTVGYAFKNQKLLTQALTHPSFNSHNKKFERLEFLGDRVLGLCISTLLLKKYPLDSEGVLAKKQAFLVSRKVCQKIGEILDLESCLKVICDRTMKGNLEAITADAVEAFLGAIYLDGGFDVCLTIVEKIWGPFWNDLNETFQDYKSKLQEIIQKKTQQSPTYHLIDQTGPAHNPLLVYAVCAEGLPRFEGKGPNRKTAEQEAAKKALMFLENQ